ncbi:MAG: hypothetical protein AB7V32_05565 [Candidatus Berkiella sp.]
MVDEVDSVAALENIPIDYHAKVAQNYKLALNSKIPNIEQLLMMYRVKEKAFQRKISPTLQNKTHEWIRPQIELCEKFILETKRIIQHCDEPTFNTSDVLDYLENLHAFREKQKWINQIDEGTNPLGPMSVLQIEAMHLTNNLLRDLNIIDLPNEEQLPTPPGGGT